MKYFLIADSLLYEEFKKIVLSYDSDIVQDSIEILKQPDSVSFNNFLEKEIDHNRLLKNAIIISQRQWLKTRDANSDVIEIMCEPGHLCNKIVNDYSTEETEERTEELKNWGNPLDN